MNAGCTLCSTLLTDSVDSSPRVEPFHRSAFNLRLVLLMPVLYLAVASLFFVSCLSAAEPPQPAKPTASKPDPSLLTVNRIYGSTDFKSEPFASQWIEDGAAYTTLERTGRSTFSSLVRFDTATGARTVVIGAEQLAPSLEEAPIAIHGYSFSKDRSKVLIFTNSKRVWRKRTRGDYWVFDRSSLELRKLGGDANSSSLMFAKFDPAGQRVAFVMDRNLYVEDLHDGRITKLTNTDSPDIINATFDWVYEEELGLRDGYRWSPDGRSIAFWQLDTEGVHRIPLVDNAAGLYPKVQWIAYPKTGQRNSACRVGVANVQSKSTTWINTPGDPRNHYIARMDWAENSDELLIQQLNRLQNTNRVMLADVNKGSVRDLHVETDAAWVDVSDELFWFDKGKQFTWMSERTGWREINVVTRDGSQPTRALLPPNESGQSKRMPFDVIRLLQVDEMQGLVYFIASPENPTQSYLYEAKFDGSGLRRVTPTGTSGTHRYNLAPDGRHAIHSFSSFDDPGTTELISLPDHKTARVLRDNKKLKERLDKLKQPQSEFFRVDIGNGVELDAWCLLPPNLDETKKYPLLIHVYGEPAGQTVVDRWSGDGGLWHRMLAQRGYVIMSFDNRGTKSPRGRDFRKCVYRKIGVMAPQDQAAATKAVLKARPFLDAERVGIWGWSGGGSSSLQAIFKYPDLYHTAVAIAPVPNQRYYDTIYQERYMGLPSDNVEGYRQGSAINFASQLKGNLLIVHGTGDDNCHYQTTELLINELVRHNKPFSMMAYPNRTHSIREGKNTTLHLRALMTNYLLQNLVRSNEP